MKKTLLLLICACVIGGCKVPGFNPQPQVKLAGYMDYSGNLITSLVLSGPAPHAVKAIVNIYNATEVTFSSYLIAFYDVSGKAYPFTVQNNISVDIPGGATPVPLVGYVPITLTNANIEAYMANNSITQMNLVITLYGTDVNGNSVQVNGSFTLY